MALLSRMLVELLASCWIHFEVICSLHFVRTSGDSERSSLDVRVMMGVFIERENMSCAIFSFWIGAWVWYDGPSHSLPFKPEAKFRSWGGK
jgi:hypothetical protein